MKVGSVVGETSSETWGVGGWWTKAKKYAGGRNGSGGGRTGRR
jgi:hypothetical protein